MHTVLPPLTRLVLATALVLSTADACARTCGRMDTRVGVIQPTSIRTIVPFRTPVRVDHGTTRISPPHPRGCRVRPGRTSAGSCTHTRMKASPRSSSCERITFTAAPPTVPTPLALPSPRRRRAHSQGWMYKLPYASERRRYLGSTRPLTHPARSASGTPARVRRGST
jgi:hypothetical protein